MLNFDDWKEFLDISVHKICRDINLYKHFQNLKTNSERIRFANNVSDWSWVEKYFEDVKSVGSYKSSKIAAELRSTGNEHFQKKDFKIALQYYNQSALHAPTPTDGCVELALAIANRSAVFFHLHNYEQCLSDISSAVEQNYPQHSLHRLRLRAAQCYIRLGQFNNAVRELDEADQLMKSSDVDPTKAQMVLREIEERRMEITKHLTDGLTQPRKSCDIKPARRSHVVPTVAYGTHSVLLHASSAIDVCVSTVKGRHLLASRAISAGDVLIVEKPYAAVLLPSYYDSLCHHCFSSVIATVPCNLCTRVHYCSKTCRKASWDCYHRIECKFMDLLHAIGVAHLSLRLILVTGLHCLLQFANVESTFKAANKEDGFQLLGVMPNGIYDSNYTAVYHLTTHEEHMLPEDLFQYALTACLLLRLLNQTDFFTASASDKTDSSCAHREEKTHDVATAREVVGALLLRHVCQLVSNAHAITGIVRSSSQSTVDCVDSADHARVLSSGRTFTRDEVSSSAVDVSQQVRLATAIYPTASLMNHSCDPSIISSFHNDVLVVRAVKDIAAGDEIFNCYGPHCRRMCRAERRQHLREQYFFECCCSACEQDVDHDLYSQALRCRNCCGPVVKSHDCYRCLECSELMTNVDRVLEAVMQADRLWQQAVKQLNNNQLEAARASLEACLELDDVCLHRHNKHLAEVHDALARCHVMLGDCVSAAGHLSASVAATEAIYGASSIELANELVKYAEVCAMADMTRVARSTAERAITLFDLNYGPDCDAIDEMNQLIHKLTLGNASHGPD